MLIEQSESAAEPSSRSVSATGTSGEYLKVRVSGGRCAVGDLVAVTLTGLDPDGSLTGVPHGRPVGIQ